MLRQSGVPQPPPPMLGLSNPPFMQNSPQPGPQQPNHMGLPPNVNNPPMNMLGGNPNNAMATPAQRYHQNHPAQPQRPPQPLLLRHSQGGQPTMPGSHMPGLTHGQPQGMGFPGNMIQQQGGNIGVRRVTSQPQLGLSQGVNNGMSMGLSPQNSMPGQLRQAQLSAQQHQLRMHQHQQMQMSSDMSMAIARQGGNPGIPQNVPRSGSAQAQLMNSLPQPPSIGHPNAMQASHHQNNFQNPVPLTSQHQQPQMSSSPRPGVAMAILGGVCVWE